MELHHFKLPTTAYVPHHYFHFAKDIMHWCYDDEIQASPPEYYSLDGKHFLMVAFGHCPLQSAVTMWIHLPNGGEIHVWEPEADSWDHEKTEAENLSNVAPLVFTHLEALEDYICNGEIG